MRIHRNAKTTPATRLLMIERLEKEGWTVSMVAAAHGVSERTVYRWRDRHLEAGASGLEDRPSRPHRIARCTPAHRVRRIVALRHKRLTAWAIAEKLRMPPSTVSAVLKRAGLSRLRALEPPPPPPRRYQRKYAGELVHLDIKPLGKIGVVGHRIHGDRSRCARGIGWEFVHVAVDDASRLAYVEVLSDQKGMTTTGFFERARKWFSGHGIRIQRVMTDNGSAYLSRKFRQALKRHEIRHLRTRPYRPETNGKAERFIKTLVEGWAYRRPYRTSNQRTKALPKWLRFYNERRPHRSLGRFAPLQSLRLAA